LIFNTENIIGETLNLEEVGLKLHLTSSKSIKKWIVDNNVRIYLIGGRKNMIYRFDLEVALLEPKALDLYFSNPKTWEFEVLPYCNYNQNYLHLLKKRIQKRLGLN